MGRSASPSLMTLVGSRSRCKMVQDIGVGDGVPNRRPSTSYPYRPTFLSTGWTPPPTLFRRDLGSSISTVWILTHDLGPGPGASLSILFTPRDGKSLGVRSILLSSRN